MGKAMFPYTIEAVAALMGLPKDMEVTDLRYEPHRCIVTFFVSSPELEETTEGREIPKKTLILDLDWKALQRKLV
jgi:hypothetical protein